MSERSESRLVADLFRRESAHLVAALVRVLGPARLPLAEDMMQEALLSATQAWRFEVPDDPKAWLLRVAKNRAIDVLRRERRQQALGDADELSRSVELSLSPERDAHNQLAMMLSICDDALSAETHVTLILRLLCGLSASEIARAFLVDVPTIDRRLHRGRVRLRELGELHDVTAAAAVRARQPSLERALYLLFNEGYHGSDPESPLQPPLSADALRLTELLLQSPAVHAPPLHALGALFCFNAARLPARLDQEGVIVSLREQDRSRFDRELFAHGLRHLGASASGQELSRWHLEAGIALEHTRAESFEATNWRQISAYYEQLAAITQSPVVELNRSLALAELSGLDAGRDALDALSEEPRLAQYSFFWAARADIERRSGRAERADDYYRRAIQLAKSRAERASYERRLSTKLQ